MKPWLLILCSACLTGLSFLSGGLAYIALARLFLLLFLYSDQITFSKGFLFGTLFSGIAFYWLIHLYPLDFLDFSSSVALVLICMAWLLVSLLHGIIYGLFCVLCRRWSVGSWQDCFTYSFLWIFAEWLQGILLFPFLTLSITQASFPSVIQSAALLGALFVSFLIALVNASLAYFLSHKRKTVLIASLLLLTINTVGGAVRLNLPASGTNTLKVALIQGNIPSNQKWQENTTSTIFETYRDLTTRAITERNPDIVVWPETVLPISLNDTHYLEELQKIAISSHTPLVIGGFYYDKQTQKDYNCVYYIRADGTVDLPMYAKRKLVPFGEFLPMRSPLSRLFPILGNINATGSDLTPGTESIVNDLSSSGRFGSLICFDSVFPHIARESVKNGAQLLVLVSNDSWFENSAGVYLHRDHAVLRAVENRRWIVRAANTGISCFISPEGEVFEALAPLTEGYTVHDVSMQKTDTLYALTGDLILLAGGCYLIYIGRKKKWKIF